MNLKLCRKKEKLTQKQVAEFLKISSQAYANYEQGTRMPDIEILIKLADYYGVSLDYLCGHETKFMLDISGLNDYKKGVIEKLKQLNEVNDYVLLGYITHMLDEQNKK